MEGKTMNELVKVEETKKDSVKKMTIEEYKAKYSKPQSPKAIKFGLYMFISGIGIVIFVCLLLAVLRVFDINQYAGYASIAVAVLVFIFFYIVPVVGIHKHRPFITNVNERTAKSAKKHNRELRESIADKMIEFTAKVQGVSWYDEQLVGQLAIARQTKDNEKTKEILTKIYATSVKTQADRLISAHALKVGLVTAASQSERLDAAFVAIYELSLIKDLVYLYGFRLSDAKLLIVYRNVVINSLLSYGVSVGSTNLISKGLSATFEGLPLLGNLVSTAISSVSQGVINGVMTCIIGIQTKRYLIKEYNLQNILDNVELDNEKEDEALIKETTEQINSKVKSKSKKKGD